jgi:hypothetical protein
MNDKNSIPGIPDGLEVIAFREAKYEETYLDLDGRVVRWTSTRTSSAKFVIVRKIEKPKRYRPFENGDEFKPHRDKWWKWKAVERTRPPVWYEDKCHGATSWQQSFDEKVFDDGSPFGVEVNE